METNRHNVRIRCDSRSLLLGLDGVAYPVRLGDLSLGGAMVEMADSALHGLHIGEMCGLVLSGDSKNSPTKHTGMIVRLESGSVGISFSRQEHQHQKKKFIAPTS